ncbi:MAG: glycine zipper domain-containing protein [Candidatus Scalindua sp.]|nr:glycine zipper domain-containing protein [Candidatus Scalindua sp.]
MNRKIFLSLTGIALVAIFTAGCLTTTQKSAGVGTGVGAALGAGIGAIVGDPALGAAIGAGAGALGGAMIGDHRDNTREKREKADLQRQLELEKQSSSGQGKNYIEGHYEYVKKREWVDTSKKERVWVEERVDGDRRIEGHYEDRLVPSGHWNEYEEKTWIPAHYE